MVTNDCEVGFVKQRPLGKTATKVYQFILDFSATNGYPPTVREICAAVRLRSPSTAHTHINTLIDRGLILRDDGKPRALKLPDGAMPGFVPLAGDVTAGEPITAIESKRGFVRYKPETDAEHFALLVLGESMINAGILDGDFVIVRQQNNAENGQIVVAMIDGEATVKRYQSDSRGECWLLPENDDYEPIDGTGCEILGIVTALVREY